MLGTGEGNGTKSTTNTNSFKFHTTSNSTDTIIIPFYKGENQSKEGKYTWLKWWSKDANSDSLALKSMLLNIM